MAMRSLGYMPSEVELAIIMQRLDMDGEYSLVGSLLLVEGGLSQCIAARGFGSKSLWSARKVWRGSCATRPFTTAREGQMTMSHQPPVDKPASQANHAREMEHLLSDQLIQLGEDRPTLATFLFKMANGLLQSCCNLSLCIPGSICPSDAYWERT